MLKKEEYDKLSDTQKHYVLEVFANQLNVDKKKLMNGIKLPKYRQLKRYCLKVINKIENNKEKK